MTGGRAGGPGGMGLRAGGRGGGWGGRIITGAYVQLDCCDFCV